ncbi:DUF4190 domain-containing protein [Enterocloster citroniae]|uniref:DUF4190 domain-containing protein n=1 Tax=Enterocloster citroniae TaxID=358743 RepID=UPI00349E5955
MARWVRDERLDQPQEFVQFLMEDYLNKNGFKKKTHKGEEVWQEGDGFLLSARFIRYEYSGGSLHLEAWIGKHRENPLKGFMGALPKKMFRESLEELISLLHQPLPQGQEQPGDHVVTVTVVDHGKYAVPSMVLSILGIVMGLMVPILGILFGGLGISFGQKARNSSKNNIARAAVILGTIAMVIALVVYIIGLVMVLFAYAI